MLKWIIGIVVVAALAAGAWYMGWLQQFLPQMQTPASQDQAQNTATEPDNGLSPASDTSDAAIAQDTAAIDGQLQASASDTTSITNSLNDQPVSQPY